MSQTWWGSIVEAKTNIVIGFTINWTANLVVLPLLWNPASPKLSAFYIGVVFTLISVARQLVIRRWFNGMRFGNKPESAATEAVDDRYRAKPVDWPRLLYGLQGREPMTDHQRQSAKAMAGVPDWSKIPVESLGRDA